MESWSHKQYVSYRSSTTWTKGLKLVQKGGKDGEEDRLLRKSQAIQHKMHSVQDHPKHHNSSSNREESRTTVYLEYEYDSARTQSRN